MAAKSKNENDLPGVQDQGGKHGDAGEIKRDCARQELRFEILVKSVLSRAGGLGSYSSAPRI